MMSIVMDTFDLYSGLGCFPYRVRLACLRSMNEARRLIGTCTDTKHRYLQMALFSTVATYVGISALPRSINIKSARAVF